MLEPPAVQFIDSLNPYKGGKEPFWRLHELNNIDKHRRLLGVGPEILFEGDGFEGQYLLKNESPSFSTISVPDREEYKQPVSVQSLIQRHHDERQALVPTLQLLVAGVEYYVEQFAPYLVRETE